MKLGCSSYSFSFLLKSGQWTLDDFLGECVHLGLDGIELDGRHIFPDPQFHMGSGRPSLERGYLLGLKEKIRHTGLEVSCLSPATLFDKPEALRQKVEELKDWINIAYLMEVPCVRIFPTEVSLLAECAEYAGHHDVTLVLENHGGQTHNSAGHIGLARAVNSPHFQLNLDTGNFETDRYRNAKKVAESGLVRHVHLKHYGYGDGVEEIDNFRIISWLEDGGYEGYFSIEYEGPRGERAGDSPEKPSVARFVSELRNHFGKAT